MDSESPGPNRRPDAHASLTFAEPFGLPGHQATVIIALVHVRQAKVTCDNLAETSVSIWKSSLSRPGQFIPDETPSAGEDVPSCRVCLPNNVRCYDAASAVRRSWASRTLEPSRGLRTPSRSGFERRVEHRRATAPVDHRHLPVANVVAVVHKSTAVTDCMRRDSSLDKIELRYGATRRRPASNHSTEQPPAPESH